MNDLDLKKNIAIASVLKLITSPFIYNLSSFYATGDHSEDEGKPKEKKIVKKVVRVPKQRSGADGNGHGHGNEGGGDGEEEYEEIEVEEEEEEEEEDEEQMMLQMMGFGGFNSTKVCS